MVDPIGLAGLIFAIGIPLSLHVATVYKNKHDMIRDAKIFCGDIHTILVDFNADNEDEEYDVDSSLRSYFNNKNTKLQNLADDLRKRNSYFGRTDQTLYSVGELLEWLIRDFYVLNYEEDERIRIWSQNRQHFFEQYYGIFNMKKSIVAQ